MTRAEYLYHSFPRRLADSDSGNIDAVLESIVKHGLLITPEIVDWRTVDGRGFKVVQKRLCFTSLDESELSVHKKFFGPVTFGFRREILEEIGAIPLFYVPRALGAGRQKRNLGGFTVERLYQIFEIVRSVRERDVRIKFRGKDINLQDMENFSRYLTTLFYPIEDVEGDRDRFYLAQKEWRIQGNLIYEGEPLSRRLTEAEAQEIKSTDESFFGRVEEFQTGSYELIEQCMLLPRIGGKPVVEAVERVVASGEMMGLLKSAFRSLNAEPEFVAIE